MPEVVAWINRMTRDPIFLGKRGRRLRPVGAQNALSMRHLVHKYFKHQKDLVPAFVDEVLAPDDSAACYPGRRPRPQLPRATPSRQSGLAKGCPVCC